MKRIVGIISALLALTIIAMPLSASAKDSGIDVGDYWEYNLTGSLSDLNVDLSAVYRIEIAGEDTWLIDGSSTAVLNAEHTMDGTMSMSLNGTDYTGTVNVTGTSRHVKSNFSMSLMSLIINMGISVGGSTIVEKVGMYLTCDPPVDQYVGNDDLSVGKKMISNTYGILSGWVSVMGLNNTIHATVSEESTTMEIVNANVPITVPAGTFDCYKVRVTTGGSSTFWYYSDQVGYYVKTEGSLNASTPGLTMGELELVKYSYGGAGTLPILPISIGVIAVVAIVVIAVLMLRRTKGQGQQPEMTPSPKQQQELNPPPPLPPGPTP